MPDQTILVRKYPFLPLTVTVTASNGDSCYCRYSVYKEMIRFDYDDHEISIEMDRDLYIEFYNGKPVNVEIFGMML